MIHGPIRAMMRKTRTKQNPITERGLLLKV
jgi:hypothetical protein